MENLKCEYRANPLGSDVARPRLSWVLASKERGQAQTAYQVLVASDLERLSPSRADLWDSGKVFSSDTLNVVYGGKALGSGQRAYWKVMVWDRAGHPSQFSAVAYWEMGLAGADWKASWIRQDRAQPSSEAQMFADNPAPLLRKEFVLNKKVRRARLYVSGLGYYEVRLNGERVGDHVLDPGWTTYSKRVLYSTYDVTRQLKRGPNALGAMLGNGWYNPLPLRLWGKLNLREHLVTGEPRLIAQLVVEFTDGSTQTVVTDDTWKTAAGPLLRNNVYLGEVYDARKERPGWDSPGFNDKDWEPAVRATEPLGPLRAQDAPPIRVTRTLHSVKHTEPKPGVQVFDLGQNFAGWIRLRVAGAAGTRIRMRYGELLYPDGSVNGMTSVCGQIKRGGANYRYDGQGAPQTAFQQDEYILKGSGEEVYVPRFTFHGFRYVEITAVPEGAGGAGAAQAAVEIKSVEGLRLNSDVGQAGSFKCSDPLLNRIQEMVLWTELSNLFSVESDCPHREKFGYGGDIVAASEMALFNFDMTRFYAKAVEDLADAVRTNGGFTETSPFAGISDEGLGGGSGPIGWGTAHPLLQWQLYQYYGDRRLMEAQYENTRAWIQLLHSRSSNGLLDNGISDHESLVPKPRALTGTAFYYMNVRLFAHIANALGKIGDATQAGARAEEIKAAFNKEFLRPGSGRYDTASQACQAFALYMELAPIEERARALNVLVQDIQAHEGHLTTGIFGTKYMLNALSDLGRADIAYQVASQRSFPGWGHMLEQGATTLWEHWEFSDNTYSHNHPMFGSVSEWLYKVPGGISLAPDAVGCDKWLIRPQPLGDLRWAKASYESVRGRVLSDWSREGDRFQLHVRVPVGATAKVSLPCADALSATEGGKPLGRAAGVSLLGATPKETVLAVGSGDYDFRCRLAH